MLYITLLLIPLLIFNIRLKNDHITFLLILLQDWTQYSEGTGWVGHGRTCEGNSDILIFNILT